ncbi:hypothetical protein HOLleu_24051 [Holothuria leucospilota]|uniref:Uncharacterized protein n=1 Tax=Holothuria leucospilota TaxID=206669 RepID=A0A9Q1H3A3_HOLLE|nr:hypothetical protein HOLleu_24051 [Holothuria leucospilota]
MDFKGITLGAFYTVTGIAMARATHFDNEDTRKERKEFLPWWVYLLFVVALIFIQYVVRLLIRSCRAKKENHSNLNDEDPVRTEHRPKESAPPSYIEVTERTQLDAHSLACPPPPSYDVAMNLCQLSRDGPVLK